MVVFDIDILEQFQGVTQFPANKQTNCHLIKCYRRVEFCRNHKLKHLPKTISMRFDEMNVQNIGNNIFEHKMQQS